MGKNPVCPSLYYLESNLLQSTERVTHVHTNNGSTQWFSLINGLAHCSLPRNSFCCYTYTQHAGQLCCLQQRAKWAIFLCYKNILCFLSVVQFFCHRLHFKKNFTWTLALEQQRYNQGWCMAYSRLHNLSGMACVFWQLKSVKWWYKDLFCKITCSSLLHAYWKIKHALWSHCNQYLYISNETHDSHRHDRPKAFLFTLTLSYH